MTRFSYEDDDYRWILEDEAARRKEAEIKGDWCPMCGFSESEHSTEEADRCFEQFLAIDRIISKMGQT